MRAMRGRRAVLIAGASVLLFRLLLFPESARSGMQEGLRLCGTSVIPALFPFLVVSSLLIALGCGELLSGPLTFLMQPLFRVDGAGACALVLGWIGGYPIGPRTTAELYRDGLLSKPEAERLLSFCNNANPAFVISVLGVGTFSSVRIGLWLWLIQIASSLLTGLLFRSQGRETPGACRPRRPSSRTASFSEAFVGAVGAGLSSILSICALVLFFYILAQPLRALPGPIGLFLSGTLELFSTAPHIPATAAGFLLASALCGWGGWSVQFQTRAVLSGSGLSLRNCFWGKLCQSILSAGLALAAAPRLF